MQNYEFELPTKEKQRELAKVLWAIEDTRKSYQKLIKRTDELVKSQFGKEMCDKWILEIKNLCCQMYLTLRQ